VPLLVTGTSEARQRFRMEPFEVLSAAFDVGRDLVQEVCGGIAIHSVCPTGQRPPTTA
jgi:hypothetical protein